MTTVWPFDVASLVSCVGPSITASVFYSVFAEKMRLICVWKAAAAAKAEQNKFQCHKDAAHTHTRVT